MRTERVTIRLSTLRKLEQLIRTGDAVTAIEILQQARNTARTAQLQACKDEAYRRFKRGVCSYERYRELWEYADSFLW